MFVCIDVPPPKALKAEVVNEAAMRGGLAKTCNKVLQVIAKTAKTKFDESGDKAAMKAWVVDALAKAS